MSQSSLNLSSLNGSNGFVISGIDDNDYSGRSVSSAGDVNGDGIDDLIIGASGADPDDGDGAGQSYVVFGNSSGFSSQLHLSGLNGSNGFTINGIDPLDRSGDSVSSAGDVNGDGIDDLIIGASGADPNGNYSGESYVVFGSSSGFDSNISLSSLDGSNGFTLNGIDTFDRSGRSVSGAGDINGDGLDDLIVGAYSADPNGMESAGESYVVFGSSSGFDSSVNLSNLNGSNGFTLGGIDAFDSLGRSVSGAGDINGDGIDDLIIGAPGVDDLGRYGGESYVVFGSSSGFDSSVNLSSLNGSNGFTLNGVDSGDNSGYSVSSAGDINGDGIDDLVIGAPFADAYGRVNYYGESYVVFGSSSGFDSSVNLSSLDGSNGFTLNGRGFESFSGNSASSAGDVNSDGIDDLIIRGLGQGYVVFGNSSGFPSSIDLERSLDGSNGFVIGRAVGSVSNAGDVNGDGIDDLILGASGADPYGIENAGESYVVFGNAAPELDLNGVDDSAPSNSIDYEAVFVGDPLVIVGHTLSLTDPNTDSIIGATVTIANLINGSAESLSATTTGTNITATYGSGTLTLSGSDTAANYQQVLRTVTYQNLTPTGATRTFEFVVDDGEAHSNSSAVATTTVTFDVGDAPVAPNDHIVVNENGHVDGNVLADNGNGADSDPAGDRLTVTAVNSSSGNIATQITLMSGALLTLNSNGTFQYDLNNQFEFLAAGENATDQFTYTVADSDGETDTATVEIEITGLGGRHQIGTSSQDQMLGSAFSDVLVGLAGKDELIGGNGRDSLEGGNGSDFLSGGGGSDTLKGQAGNDTLLGGTGIDWLQGGGSDDSLSGGLNNDTLEGQAGNDTLLGGQNNDVLYGAAGHDVLYGGLGHDALYGGHNRDTLAGQAGNDTLEGQTGSDVLLGSGGNDVLVGGSNNDTLTGGAGADAFRFDIGFNSLGLDTITDFSSNDVLQLSQSTFGLGGVIGAEIAAQEFASVGSLAAAENSSALIAYNRNDGSLYFNANGSAAGLGSGGQFAQLDNDFGLTASHLELVA